MAVAPAAQLVHSNASILSWKQDLVQRKHFGHHITDLPDLHMLASPQLLVADMTSRSRKQEDWPQYYIYIYI